ncbi:3D domain-containing protein [Thalassobacillus hwangdonensis]|uniref:3D domain-containing protein n=1 Tax=Thalassobacillus hwangdonensis TaxID=546108 RepID=A0ABW3KYE3_9BACI
MKKWMLSGTAVLMYVLGIFSFDTGQPMIHADEVKHEQKQDSAENKVNDIDQKQIALKEKSEQLKRFNKSEEKTSDKNDVVKTVNVEATAYTAFCDGCSGITKTGIDLRANPDKKVIAVDPDVIPLGTEVYVPGYGKAVAGDIGSAIQGNRIDIYMEKNSDALDFGRRQMEIQILG